MTSMTSTTSMSTARHLAVEAPLSSAEEERLSDLVEELSEAPPGVAQERLEVLASAHPHLAGHLRELFAAMLVTDAVAERSTVFDRGRGPVDDPVVFGPAPTADGLPRFVPGVTALPATLGDYELLEEIGRGGMGVVYRAAQRSLGRTVAIKMLLRRDLATAADLTRFRSEAEAAARLDHPGIVPIFEVGEFDGLPFYSMRFIEGTTLAKQLASGPLPAREAAALLARVADAVQAAHERGVLHRDLKPSNILIDSSGRPHVSDFGLAKRIEDDASVTYTGAILYQTLTGRPPFQASNPMDTLLAVLETDPPAPRTVAAGVDRDLEMIALKSLQKPQELRYASAGGLAADLRGFLAGEMIAARRGGLADVAARLFRETHHAVVLENWGLLWMWHSVVILALSVTTDVLAWQGVTNRWPYTALWGGGLALWAPIFWALRHRTGPVTAVERQIAHVWGGSVIASVMLFWVEGLLHLGVLTLSPVLALLAGLVFFAKAGILSGVFYVQAAVLFATALVMCLVPTYQHVIFGLVSAACFFVPGYKYFRQRLRAE